MRHRKSGRKFNMDASQRKAMFRNMVTSLMLHGQIRTTEARAKELRRFADRVITIGKKAPSQSSIEGLSGDEARQAQADRVAAIRRVRQWVNNDEALALVFDEYAERFRSRPGGYTRVVKTGVRAGDNAKMAVISLVGDLGDGPTKVATSDDLVADVAADTAAEAAADEAVEAAAEADEEATAVDTAAADEEATAVQDVPEDFDDDDEDATVVMSVETPSDDDEGEVVED